MVSASVRRSGRRRRLPWRPLETLRNVRTLRSSADSGYAMLVTLVVISLLSVALALIGMSLALRLRTAREEARAVSLGALCDAALAETLANLSAGHTADLPERPLGSGTIASRVEAIDLQHFRIRATARFENKARTVVADVVRDSQGTRVVHWRRLSG